MQTPEFSEFTFGYALTDNLVHRVLTGVRGVPIFPSLSEEGKDGVGYDVKIPRHSMPLFLQFKLPQVVRRHRKVWSHNLTPIYYRMHLMQSTHSTQHRSLLRLARRGQEVYYVAPAFHNRSELSRFHSSGEVPSRSAFFAAQDIGKLNDERHHVAYTARSSTAWLCSKPRAIDRPCTGEYFTAWLGKAAQAAPLVESPEKFLDDLAEKIIQSATEDNNAEERAIMDETEESRQSETVLLRTTDWRNARIADLKGRLASQKEWLGPRRFVGYAARLLLDCELMMVGHGEGI